ncbi:MAG: hypothetical protein HY098_05090 [Nitrospinae bacterium]|nr:hypothetical protein [Nitrospinota bacterium]
MKKKALVVAGYALLFTAAVAVFILRGIDGEAVRPALEAAFKENTGADLKMKNLDLSLPFSATLIDMELTTPDKRGKVRLDSLEIRPVYWKLVFLTPTVRLVMRSRDSASTPMGVAELRVASKILDDASSSALSGALVLNPKGKIADTVSALYSRNLRPDGAYYFPVTGTLASPKFGL